MFNKTDFSTKGINTRAIHAGELTDPQTGASAPNLVMSSTFAVTEPLEFSATDLEEDAPYVYGRWGNPTVKQLEEKLAALDDTEDCVCLASGMAAASAAFLTFLSAGDHLIISDTNYAGIAELSRNTLTRFGIEVSPVNTARLELVEEALKPNTKMIWIETPANPILRLTDILKISSICKAKNILLGVDATFSTPIATRPANLGADLVMHSLTKYIGGHGDALGGSIAGKRSLVNQIRQEAVIHQGAVLSPFNAWLIMRGAATLKLRMQAHEKGALAVATFLENHKSVKRVIYPGLESHPQYDLACSQMDNYSAMMCFQVNGGEAVRDKMMQQLEIIHHAVSLGHHRSLIYWMNTDELMQSSYKLGSVALEDYRSFAGDGIFRLSVGLEDSEDLCADLDRVLSG